MAEPEPRTNEGAALTESSVRPVVARATRRWSLRTFSSRLRRGLSLTASVPWLARYDLTTGVIPSGFKLSQFKGLVHLHAVREEDGGTRLLSYWEAKDFYSAGRVAFETALGLASTAAAGLVSDSYWRRDWWPRSAPEWLLKATTLIAALIGVVTMLSGAYWGLFGSPLFSMEPPPLGLVNVVEGDSVSLPIDVTNQHSKVACDVAVTAAADSRSLSVRPRTVRIPTGETKTVVLTARFAGVGKHTVRVEGSARGGWLNPFTQRAQTAVDVVIWKRKAEGAFRGDTAKGESCTSLASLRVGEDQPGGLTCEAWVIRPGDLRFRAVTSIRSRSWEDPLVNPELGRETMLVRWRMEPMSAFEEVPVRIHVGHVGAPRVLSVRDCDEFAKQIHWRCERP